MGRQVTSPPDCLTALCPGDARFSLGQKGLCWSQKFKQACCHWVAQLEVWKEVQALSEGDLETPRLWPVVMTFASGLFTEVRKCVAWPTVWISYWTSLCCNSVWNELKDYFSSVFFSIWWMQAVEQEADFWMRLEACELYQWLRLKVFMSGTILLFLEIQGCKHQSRIVI